MDLGRSTSPIGRYDGRSVTELLTEASTEVRGRQASQIREWLIITAWADQNVVETSEGAATLVEGVIDTGVSIAGDGAPLVSEFNLMELIATLGRTPDGGRAYVGRVIECAWRLHGVFAAVLEGRIRPWKAERIADLTRSLNADAAGFVDRHLAAVRDPGWAQIERLVREAEGGKTCPCNLVPLCRRHHRAKTFSDWRYITLEPGRYLWTSPHGRRFLAGPGGTRALDPPRSTHPGDY